MKRGEMINGEKARSADGAHPTREADRFDRDAALAVCGMTHERSSVERRA